MDAPPNPTKADFALYVEQLIDEVISAFAAHGEYTRARDRVGDKYERKARQRLKDALRDFARAIVRAARREA